MAEDIRICFIGDSFVNGTGDETALGWAGRLCAAASAQGAFVTYYNLGIRRETSRDILRRWEQDCALRLPASCDGRLVLSFGANDTVIEDGAPRVPPEESCGNLRTMLVGAKKYQVLVVGPPPVDDDVQNSRIERLSRAFADEARALEVPYIELFSSLVADQAYRQEVAGSDGSHPRSKGYEKIARIVARSPQWWFGR